MNRDGFEAELWKITGRQLTGAQIDAIVAAAGRYIAERLPHRRTSVCHHTSGTDLYPVISVLADAMLNQRPPEPYSSAHRAPIGAALVRHISDPAERHEVAQMLGLEPTPVPRGRDRKPRRGAA